MKKILCILAFLVFCQSAFATTRAHWQKVLENEGPVPEVLVEAPYDKEYQSGEFKTSMMQKLKAVGRMLFDQGARGHRNTPEYRQKECFRNQSHLDHAIGIYNLKAKTPILSLKKEMYTDPDGELISDLLFMSNDIEPDCEYKSYGPLNERRYIIYCTYHGSFMEFNVEQALAASGLKKKVKKTLPPVFEYLQFAIAGFVFILVIALRLRPSFQEAKRNKAQNKRGLAAPNGPKDGM